MDYTKGIKLDLNPSSVPPVIRVKQGDGFARYVQVTLTRDGVTYIPESGITYLFRCEKPDGTAVITDSVSTDTELQRKLIIVDNQTGIITIEIVDQVDAVVGRCKCDLCLLKDEKALSTLPFFIEVLASPDVANRAVSSDDFRTLENLIGDVAEAVEEAQEAVENAQQAVEDAETAVEQASSAATSASKAAQKVDGLTVDAVALAPNTTPTATITGGTEQQGVVTPYNISFGIPSGMSPVPEETYSYQNSTSGTSHPTSGTWTENPNPEKGKYTWRKTVTNWKVGSVLIGTTTDYDVAYQGVDGSGAVQSVNGKQGAVVLNASDIKTAANKTIENVLAGITFKLLGTV